MRAEAGGLVGAAASPAALESADAAEVLGGCLHAWAAGFLRSLRMHEESAGSARTAPAAAQAVRQLRAASRRIGSALHTYRPLVDAAWADDLSGELRRLSGTLARECRADARRVRLLAALRRLAVEGTGGDRAAALLERQHALARSRAHSAALETLVSSRFHAVADAVAVLAYEVPLAPDAPKGRAGEVLVPLAERALKRLAGAVEALPQPARIPAAPDGRGGLGGHELQRRQDAAWLEVRILLRHHRYAQEVLYAAGAPPAGACRGGQGGEGGGRRGGEGDDGRGGEGGDSRSAEGPRPDLARASAALDRLRDAVEAADAAASAARTPRIAPATAYALGVLHAGQRQEAETARHEFGELWEQAVSDGREVAGQVL